MAESSTMPADSVTSARWAAERFALFAESSASLDALRAAENSLNLPFEVVPCALKECPSLEDVRRVLPLAAESVVTSSGAVVEERRHTAWLTDAEDIGGLAYSGKIMSPKPFPNAVKSLRDSLCRSLDTDELDYDCALVNLYPTGGAACKYHIDPEHGSQGDLKAYWARDQAVLSLGEVRRFAFRDTQGQHHHVFHLFHGDCVHMFGNCQEEYQHCVFKAEDDLTNRDPRLSFVFKRALLRPTGKQPRGHAGFTEIGNDHLKKRETRQPRPRRRPTKKRRRGS